MAGKRCLLLCPGCGLHDFDAELTFARLEVAEAAKKVADSFLASTGKYPANDAETHAMGLLLARVALLRERERAQ